jgi:hypothetical protein
MKDSIASEGRSDSGIISATERFRWGFERNQWEVMRAS